MTHLAHLHLPRYQRWLNDDSPNVISIKPSGGRVFYVPTALMRDVRFTVSEKGRQRTLQTGQRNVHAWVVGDYCGAVQSVPEAINKAVYDPWKGDSFVDVETLEPIHHASVAYMVNKHVYYKP